MTERNFVLYPLKRNLSQLEASKNKRTIDFLIKNLKTPNNEITKLSKMI